MADDSAVEAWWRQTIPHTFAPTENMMRWMGSYERPCHHLCCLSEDCATIKCGSCYATLTTVPPQPRFECMEASWLGADLTDYEELCAVLREGFADGRPTLCSDCFHSERFQYDRTRFLLVQPNGEHSIVTREQGLAEERRLSIQDFRVVRQGDWQGKECQCCFDTEEPPVGPAGCPKGHGLPVKNEQGRLPEETGAVDSEEYYCGPCSLMYVQSTGKDRYYGALRPWAFCAVCAQEAQTESFVEEWQLAKSWIEDDGVSDAVFERINNALATNITPGQVAAAAEEGPQAGVLLLQTALKALHKQPWLQSRIDIL